MPTTHNVIAEKNYGQRVTFLLVMLCNIELENSLCHNVHSVATPAIAAQYGLVAESWTFSEVQVRSLREILIIA